MTVYNRKGKHVSGGKTVNLKDYKGVKKKSVPTFENGKLNAIVYSVIATFLALFSRYDVIHFHAEGPCSMIWLPHLFGIHTVATIHGLDWQRAKWGGFATKFLKFGEKTAAKYADELIVLSVGTRDYFKETYGRETVFIPNGIDVQNEKKADIITKKYGLEKDGYILFLARIVPEKGLHYLIDAFMQTDTDKKLVIAGGVSHSGEYAKQIHDMAKDDISIKIYAISIAIFRFSPFIINRLHALSHKYFQFVSALSHCLRDIRLSAPNPHRQRSHALLPFREV